MCERWRDDFAAFLLDMGERPQNTSLDRIDNDRGYEPGNCRWATSSEQAINKRHVKLFDWDGERVILRVIAERSGVPYGSLQSRMKRHGGTVADAVSHYVRARASASLDTSPPLT